MTGGLVTMIVGVPAETWAALGVIFTAIGGAIGAVATWLAQRRRAGPSSPSLQRTLFDAAERLVRLNVEARDAAEADIRGLVVEVKALRAENADLVAKVEGLTREVNELRGEVRASREEIEELEEYIGMLVASLDALGAPIPPRPRFSRSLPRDVLPVEAKGAE
jgi:cell division protein FtsB